MELGQYGKAFLGKPLAKNYIDDGSIDSPILKCLTEKHLITDHQESNIISVRVDSQPFQAQDTAHPERPTDAGDSEPLAAQLFRAFYARPRNQIVSDSVGQHCQNL